MEPTEALRTTFLHHFGAAIREVLTAVPMPVVRGIFVMVLVALLWWVVRLPRERVSPPGDTGAAGRGWSSNLKLWAGVALGLQILIYLSF